MYVWYVTYVPSFTSLVLCESANWFRSYFTFSVFVFQFQSSSSSGSLSASAGGATSASSVAPASVNAFSTRIEISSSQNTNGRLQPDSSNEIPGIPSVLLVYMKPTVLNMCLGCSGRVFNVTLGIEIFADFRRYKWKKSSPKKPQNYCERFC